VSAGVVRWYELDPWRSDVGGVAFPAVSDRIFRSSVVYSEYANRARWRSGRDVGVVFVFKGVSGGTAWLADMLVAYSPWSVPVPCFLRMICFFMLYEVHIRMSRRKGPTRLRTTFFDDLSVIVLLIRYETGRTLLLGMSRDSYVFVILFIYFSSSGF